MAPIHLPPYSGIRSQQMRSGKQASQHAAGSAAWVVNPRRPGASGLRGARAPVVGLRPRDHQRPELLGQLHQLLLREAGADLGDGLQLLIVRRVHRQQERAVPARALAPARARARRSGAPQGHRSLQRASDPWVCSRYSSSPFVFLHFGCYAQPARMASAHRRRHQTPGTGAKTAARRASLPDRCVSVAGSDAASRRGAHLPSQAPMTATSNVSPTPSR